MQGSNLAVVGLLVLIVLVLPQAVLSTRRSMVPGIVMPAFFLLFSGYYLYLDVFVAKPYPTMGPGMLMTFGLIGFGVSAITLVVCRLIMKTMR